MKHIVKAIFDCYTLNYVVKFQQTFWSNIIHSLYFVFVFTVFTIRGLKNRKYRGKTAKFSLFYIFMLKIAVLVSAVDNLSGTLPPQIAR